MELEFFIMIVAYIRVSTEKQTEENQHFEIQAFCSKEGIIVDQWFYETISGTKSYSSRELGKLLKKVKSGDTIICTELSRLGRELFMIMDILCKCIERGCKLWTLKEGYRLGGDIQSKVMAFAFGLSAELERELISQRTKEALRCRKASGMKLGRPAGARTDVKRSKLYSKRAQILRRLAAGESKRSIANLYHTDSKTLNRFLEKLEDE